ncbi:MAG: group II truncated hemoglobin [Sphingomonadaceae bacterium]
MQAEAEAPVQTPFEMIGGAASVRRIVDHFYDLMEQEPQYKLLRDMHAPDLGPMRDSLSGFLTAWLGGPRTWFSDRPGTCVMSLHRALPMTPETVDQWLDAMQRALLHGGVDPEIAEKMGDAFRRMAMGMSRS